jgi:hypothetical protein
MENNFNKNIKNSFENYELPYDSAAWDQLSKKLDVSMPVKNKPKYKLIIAASIITAVVVSSIYVVSNSETTPENTSDKVENTPIISEEKINSTSTTKSNEAISHAKEVTTLSEISEVISANYLSEEKQIEGKEVIIISDNSIKTTETKGNTTPSELKMIISPISSTCLGESVEIKNTNLSDILLISSTDKTIVIKGKASILFTPKVSGEYEIGYLKGDNFISKEKFNVNAGPKADFYIDNESNFNDKGLPTINLKANSNSVNYNWTFEKHAHTVDTKETEVHYYNAGTYKITLTTTSENGCKTSETNKVTVKDYDLMAANTINISDENSKNRMFMPYALTVRNVRFNLTILDPITGEIIFQTDDANQPWDGTDKRTGNSVTGTNYIWKVVIANPQPGENANYKGVITRL